MKKDIETLVAEEREQILLKYASGRHGGVQVDSWEDGDYCLYKAIDRFGFLHEDELPAPTAQELKIKQVEVQRAEKWLKMVRKWEKYRSSDRMVKRVYKGIPLQLRGRVWSLLLDLETRRRENQGQYQVMKSRALLCSPDIKQIDLDVNRTFRDHVMFRDRFGLKQQSLFYVLSAYSVYNTEVGYCQGMSQIAALLLMFLNEEEAFWALSQLLTGCRHAMHGFFVPGFPKLQRFQTHHDQILWKLLPTLKKHLDREQMSAGIYSTKWFLQCFITRTPFPLTLRLWDVFILEGERLLTAMSYTVLKIHNKLLLRLGLEDLRDFLQEKLSHTFFLSDDDVISQLITAMTELRKRRLDLPPAGKRDEFPLRPLGHDLPLVPVVLSPLHDSAPPTGGGANRGTNRVGSSGLLPLHLGSSSPDQSRSGDAPEGAEPPILIHSQAPPTPDGSPPHRPPEARDDYGGPAGPSCPPETATPPPSGPSPKDPSAPPPSAPPPSAPPSFRRLPRTLSAPVAPVAPPPPGLVQSESLWGEDRREDKKEDKKEERREDKEEERKEERKEEWAAAPGES